MRRVVLSILLLLVVAFVGFAAYVRLAPSDPARWHVDPETAVEEGRKNDFIVKPGGAGADIASPVFSDTPEVLLARFRAAALGEPGVTVLSEEGGFVTFVARTKLMGYPDFVSVKAVPAEGGAALFIHSRSRFGSDDFGVNAARVSAWLDRL